MEEKDLFQDMVPADVLGRMIKYWWIIAISIVVGGIIGSLFPYVRKPLFESTSVITTAIDFAYSGKLSDLEEDHMIVAIGNIVGSSEVLQKVQKDAAVMGITLREEELEERFALSRQGYQWELSTRFEDATITWQLNQAWLTAAASALDEARIASIEALRVLDAGDELEACLSQSVNIDPVVTPCDPVDLQQLLSELTMNTPDQQQAMTHFLLSRITTTITQDPFKPEKPVLFNRNLTTIAGGMLGLILVLAYFSLSNAKLPSR